jgi:hypothetical protein
VEVVETNDVPAVSDSFIFDIRGNACRFGPETARSTAFLWTSVSRRSCPIRTFEKLHMT